MATVYLGVNVGGQDATDVLIDSSTNSTDIELTIDDSVITAADPASKDKLLEALHAIEQWVIENSLYSGLS